MSTRNWSKKTKPPRATHPSKPLVLNIPLAVQ